MRDFDVIYIYPRSGRPGVPMLPGWDETPGAELDEEHELVGAIDASHEEIFGARPERDVTRWFSDASALTRYGIPTVNYGTSTGLMDVELGENLEIEGLAQTAEVYARVAMDVCGVA